MTRIGFIGTGNLASAIIRGLKQNNTEYHLNLYDVFEEKVTKLAQEYEAHSCTFSQLIDDSEIIILAVKPKDIKSLLQELAYYSLSEKLIITVAAGIGLSVYEQALPNTAIIRVMPNTSSSVLQAVSGMVRGRNVNDEQAGTAEKIFSAVGKVLWLEDDKINALTAVSGSGPAYFYLFTEFMTEAGEKLGLTKQQSEFLARETLVGAGRMLADDSRSAKELREAVTSPNGTTEAAIKSFIKQGLDKTVYDAMLACYKRAEEMEGEYS